MGESPLDKLAEPPALGLRECCHKRLAGPQRTTSQAVRPGDNALTLSDDRCIAQKSDAALRDGFLSVIADT